MFGDYFFCNGGAIMEQEGIDYFFIILFIVGFALGISLGIIALLLGDILFSITFFGLGITLLICAIGINAVV